MTRHTLHTCLPYGDPDLGAEVELRITFTCLFGAPAQGPSYYSGGQPADPDEIEFVSCVKMCNGKPSPPNHSFADMEQASLDDMAREYLESDDGHCEALEVAASDAEAAREYAAELRADR
jgi:hypothetical protein